MLTGATIAIATSAVSGYNHRVAARHAAQLFVRDLSQARAHAVRGRESVVVRFSEPARFYTVTTVSTGRELIKRRFTSDGDLPLAAIDLEMPGDSLSFNSRGISNLSGMGAQLGTATFSTGDETYEVSFNTLGTSKVEQR